MFSPPGGDGASSQTLEEPLAVLWFLLVLQG